MLILWPLSQTSSLPPSRLLPSHPRSPPPPCPPPLFLVLPTSSPGNKDFHSCARGHPQQGREKKGRGGGGAGRRWGCQGGTVLRITAIRPKAQNCVLFLCFGGFFAHGVHCLNRCLATPDLEASMAPSVSSERVGGKVWKLGFIQHFHTWINALTLHLRAELRMYSSARKHPIICAQSFF